MYAKMRSEDFLVEEKVIVVKKDRFQGVGVIGGLDRGCTLTKVLFSTEKDSEHYNLHFALFRNRHFEAGLEYLKRQGMVVQQPGAKLHVTGAGCDMYRDVIREKLGLETQFIDEMLTQGRGTHWLLCCADDSELCHPDPELAADEVSLLESLPAKMFVDAWRREIGELTDGKFPCLLLLIGSGGGIYKLEENGTADVVGGVWLAGRSFLGLSQLLLGTSDYDEIMRLAAKGRRQTLDTVVQDVLTNDPDSPYGSFPPDFPLFSFGKLADAGGSLSEFPREDVALSLLFTCLGSAFTSLILASKTMKVGKLYIGGNFFRSELPRRMLQQLVAMFGVLSDETLLRMKFLKTGHTGAIGAMISNPEDLQKYLAFMQQQQQQQQQQQ